MGQWKITAVHTQAAEKIYIRGEKRMGKEKITDQAMYDFYGKMPLKRAIPLGLQHVLAMFVGNLTPLLIICGACGISGSEEFAHLQVCLLQNAMFVAGVVTLVQLYAIGPIGGKVPIIMGTSSGFIGVFKSVADTMGGGLATYGAIMGASILGGLFESVLGFFIKPLRKFFPAVVTGTVVLSIGLSLISVGINSFGGGSGAKDFGSMENLLLAIFVLVVILTVKHWTNGIASNSAILIGIIAGYIAAFVMSLVLPTTGITADGAEYTKAWVLNWDKVAQASWISIPEFLPVKPVFDARAIAPILIMFIVTAVETVGDISGVIEGGMNREATDKELSGGVICDGIGSSFAALFGILPNTSFSQNVGLVTMTKVVNRTAPLRSCSEAGRHRFYYAAGCSRRRSRYDVLIHRDQRNPAGHKGEDDSEEPDYRFCSAWSWLWNGSEHGNLSSDPAGDPADLRRFRNCSGGYGCDFVEYCASE